MGWETSTDAEVVAAAGLLIDQRQTADGAAEFLVTGDTHPHRNLFRQVGGAWDKLKRLWRFAETDPTAAIAEALRAEPPPAPTGLSDSSDNKPHYWGHRQRLRERFLYSGPDALTDYELLELLLFHSIPRIDVKPLAKELIERFGGFAGVLAAEPERLAEFERVGQSTVVHLKAVQAAAFKLMQSEIAGETVLTSWSKLVTYLKASLGHEKKERFRIIFLNTRNAIIADEVQQEGTVNHTPVYPREVIKRALELGATALIMVHNHPSGDSKPSAADIQMTHEVAEAGERLGIVLHDHVVVSKNGHTSFKDSGLL